MDDLPLKAILTPNVTRWLLWGVFWALACYDVLVISTKRYDATISNVLYTWNREADGIPGALLLALWAHSFWK